MNKLFVSLSLMMIICAASAQIYKWTDSQGNVHFSDTPHPGAQVINIPEPQSFSPQQRPAAAPRSMTPEPEKTRHAYTRIAIVQPENGATIRNNQGFVVVTVQVDPELHRGDMLQLLYDALL